MKSKGKASVTEPVVESQTWERKMIIDSPALKDQGKEIAVQKVRNIALDAYVLAATYAASPYPEIQEAAECYLKIAKAWETYSERILNA